MLHELLSASADGDTAAIARLLAADPYCIRERDRDGLTHEKNAGATALLVATRAGHADAAQLLLGASTHAPPRAASPRLALELLSIPRGAARRLSERPRDCPQPPARHRRARCRHQRVD